MTSSFYLYSSSAGRERGKSITPLRQAIPVYAIFTALKTLAMNKIFKLKAEQIKKLIEPMGGCIATDKITVEGELVDYMIREEPNNDIDSGWQFYSGTEDQEYIDNPENSAIYDVNTIANYDPAIIPYLNLPIGTQLERIHGTNTFRIIPG